MKIDELCEYHPKRRRQRTKRDTERSDRSDVELPGGRGRRGRSRRRGLRIGGARGDGDSLQLRGRCRIGGGRTLRDLFFDHPQKLLVGRPEGLADADRIIDNLGDRRIPVPPLAVVEKSVAANEKI